jgi:hypothetical protein
MNYANVLCNLSLGRTLLACHDHKPLAKGESIPSALDQFDNQKSTQIKILNILMIHICSTYVYIYTSMYIYIYIIIIIIIIIIIGDQVLIGIEHLKSAIKALEVHSEYDKGMYRYT